MTRLCGPCRDEVDRWLYDTKPSTHVRLGIRITEFATYDGTAAGIRERERARHEEWRLLVRRQTALIETICARQHRPGQIALFEVAA